MISCFLNCGTLACDIQFRAESHESVTFTLNDCCQTLGHVCVPVHSRTEKSGKETHVNVSTGSLPRSEGCNQCGAGKPKKAKRIKWRRRISVNRDDFGMLRALVGQFCILLWPESVSPDLLATTISSSGKTMSSICRITSVAMWQQLKDFSGQNPQKVLSEYAGEIRAEDASRCSHASLAMTRQAFDHVGGCPLKLRRDFDQQLVARLNSFGSAGDHREFATPAYLFPWGSTGAYHGQPTMQGPDDENWYERVPSAKRSFLFRDGES